MRSTSTPPSRTTPRQSIQALKKGKHVACTVPMATTVEECREIVRLVQETGLTYTMMETVVYAREFLFVRDLYLKGDLGKIQFLQASHQQDMDGWPGYWPGLPPMYYATHCVGPCLALTRASAEYVSCFGSGRIRDEMVPCYGSPFAVETTHIKLANSDLTARIYRSLFDVARQYRESFDVYGSKQTYEWPLVEGEKPVLHTAKKPEPEIPQRVEGAGLRAPAARAASSASPPRASTTTTATSTCRSRRAAATAARIRTWPTCSSRPCGASSPPTRTPWSRPTGPAPGSWPTNRRCRAGRSSACPTSPCPAEPRTGGGAPTRPSAAPADWTPRMPHRLLLALLLLAAPPRRPQRPPHRPAARALPRPHV
jgi:predicted dehydrogenase